MYWLYLMLTTLQDGRKDSVYDGESQSIERLRGSESQI